MKLDIKKARAICEKHWKIDILDVPLEKRDGFMHALNCAVMLPAALDRIEELEGKPREGLFGKYILRKSDGSPVDPEADYFVLRLDTDPIARLAALEYSYQTDDEQLAHDISDRVVKYLIEKPKKRPVRWEIQQVSQLKEQIALLKAALIEERTRGNLYCDHLLDWDDYDYKAWTWPGDNISGYKQFCDDDIEDFRKVAREQLKKEFPEIFA